MCERAAAGCRSPSRAVTGVLFPASGPGGSVRRAHAGAVPRTPARHPGDTVESGKRQCNSGPLKKTWLSRFGPTLAGHVTGAVSDRLSGPLTGAQATVSGQSLVPAGARDEALLGQTLVSIARKVGAPSVPGTESGEARAGPWPETEVHDSSAIFSSSARYVSGASICPAGLSTSRWMATATHLTLLPGAR